MKNDRFSPLLQPQRYAVLLSMSLSCCGGFSHQLLSWLWTEFLLPLPLLALCFK